jgi:YVTN family beta-propeller protein
VPAGSPPRCRKKVIVLEQHYLPGGFKVRTAVSRILVEGGRAIGVRYGRVIEQVRRRSMSAMRFGYSALLASILGLAGCTAEGGGSHAASDAGGSGEVLDARSTLSPADGSGGTSSEGSSRTGGSTSDSSGSGGSNARDAGKASHTREGGDAGSTDDLGGMGGRAYVSIYGQSEITVIDTSARQVIDHISLGSGRGPSILLKTPDGKKLYTANWKDNTLTAVDVATQAVTPIPLASRPMVAVVSAQGDFVYAGLASDAIAVVSTATDTVIRTLTPNISSFQALAISPDGATLYISTGLVGGAMQAFSTSSGAMIKPSILVGSTPAWIVMTTDGSKLYTLNFTSNDISVVDTRSWMLSGTISAGAGVPEPLLGAITPTGTLLVTNYLGANVIVVEPSSGKIARTLAVDGRAYAIDVSRDGTRAYVTHFGRSSLATLANPFDFVSGDLSSELGSGPGEVVTFDPSTGMTIGDPIPVGAGPTGVVLE